MHIPPDLSTMTTNSTQTIPVRFGSTVWQLPEDGAASIRASLPPIEDLHSEVERALGNPTDFASIDQMIVAGDIVALAIDPNIPSLNKVVCSITQWFIEHGVPIENLRIVFGGNEHQMAGFAQGLADGGLAGVSIERHDPDDVNCVSYVAADEEAQPIYINRVLVDADVVIPISCARSRDAIDYLGSFSVFPLFSNRDIRGQFYSYARLSDYSEHQKLIDRSDQAAWWLGLLCGVQIVPAGNDQVGAILCGLLSAVDETVQERLTKSEVDEELTDLVIACLDSPAQDWFQVAHALHHAARFSSQGGTIVLCTELAEAIGPALRRLKDAQSTREQISKRIAKDPTDDSLAAGAIFEATRDRHLYFISKHRSDTVESLGMGVLANEEQLIHLARQYARYLVIPSAQHG
jgi:nickel-dependent lactate racemase